MTNQTTFSSSQENRNYIKNNQVIGLVYLNSETKYQLSEHITAIWKMMGYVNHDTKKSLAASLTPETIFNILFDLSDKSVETINYVKVIDTLT